MSRKRIVILGAAGMAREIAWLVRDLNRKEEQYQLLGFVVSDMSTLGLRDSREQVLGDYEWLTTNTASIDCVTVGIGSPAARLKVAREVAGILPNADWPALVHPTAVFDRETATVNPGVQICAGFLGTVNVSLGSFSLCNFSTKIGHETTIGAGSVINPGATICGGVVIAESVLVGAGAVVLQYVNVGSGAVVGAGAVVTKDVSANTTVVGIPARALSHNRSAQDSVSQSARQS